MAKRELSADFRRGAAIANGALCRWKLSGRTKHMPEELYASLAKETGDTQRGMIECFAAFIRVVIEGSTPILGNWDPLEELEDADELYGDSEVDDD
ncbi:hypothetical protein KTE50_15320 [Burkholderia multivorans]|uniref:hypothetical protein n=1 Tax=Burkholderia multivorans TaxID=87883 RepID=UPI001C2658AF|nr:hypothetical protein [Burkholderia multivorans]MBU9549915.1 hypothetical protein [Burkholderia multivorans]